MEKDKIWGVPAVAGGDEMKFRKKPVVIDAICWDGANTKEVCGFVGPLEYIGGELRIETLEGTMRATPGDWIIKGVKGEFYPCKPDIFAASYEEV